MTAGVSIVGTEECRADIGQWGRRRRLEEDQRSLRLEQVADSAKSRVDVDGLMERLVADRQVDPLVGECPLLGGRGLSPGREQHLLEPSVCEPFHLVQVVAGVVRDDVLGGLGDTEVLLGLVHPSGTDLEHPQPAAELSVDLVQERSDRTMREPAQRPIGDKRLDGQEVG